MADSKSDSTNLSYYQRYLKSARKFAIVGAVGTAAGLLVLMTATEPLRTAGLVVFLIGALASALGGSSMLPHNAVRAFARQCAQNPSREAAEGLIEALNSRRKIRLSSRSLVILAQAAAGCQHLEDGEALSEKIQQACKDHIVRKSFLG